MTNCQSCGEANEPGACMRCGAIVGYTSAENGLTK